MSVPFAMVAESARKYNETAIGYRTKDGKVVLAPEPTHELSLQPGDKVVVFAEDFVMSKAKNA